MSKDQGKSYSAGVKEYRETYWMPEYVPKDTDFLACFKITPQEGVPREEAAAAVAALVRSVRLVSGLRGVRVCSARHACSTCSVRTRVSSYAHPAWRFESYGGCNAQVWRACCIWQQSMPYGWRAWRTTASVWAEAWVAPTAAACSALTQQAMK